jgi:hypothetical protein
VTVLAFGVNAAAQDKTTTPAPTSSFCTLENALGTIQEQVDASRTFDNELRRIAVLLRAADALWPHRQEKARAVFAEAFEVGTRNFKTQGDNPKQEGRLVVGVPDQRFTIITAIAKRDPEWARKLSKQVLDEAAEAAKDDATKDPRKDANTGGKLLSMATTLIASDQATALAFARNSLVYPATIYLPGFLYKLTDINRVTADRFYQEALSAYARAPMDQFLYLSSYPFARNREVGEMPAYSFYQVPVGLKPNPALQRLFVQTLLSRAQEIVQNPASNIAGYRYSDAAQILMALTRLEPEIATSLVDLSPALQEAKGNIAALLSPTDQQRAGDALKERPKRSFDEQIEAADKLTEPELREGGLSLAIISAPDTETVEHIEASAMKIDDLALRGKILSRVVFNRAQRLIKDGKLAEARRLAAKVDEVDLRAFLFTQIAAESIKQNKGDTQARELLAEILADVDKAPHTEVKARALLALASLYSSFDPNRAIAVLSEAIKCINHLENPDFSRESVTMRIESKAFGSYQTMQTPGFSPERAFREIGKNDLDGVLYIASNLADKPLRALSLIALAEQCLANIAAKPKPNKPIPPKP